MNKFRTVDLFCGGGGLSCGLSAAGFDVVASFDCWQPAIDFYNQNIKDHYAYKLDLGDVKKSVETIRAWNPTVIVGGPPCQDYSAAGKRNENGGRASLTLSYANIVIAIRPPMFIMENVDLAIKSKTYKKALDMFADAGYHLTVTVLDASLCGVPQKRKRAFAVGTLKEARTSLVDVFKRHLAERPMTIRDYLGNALGTEYYYRHPRSYVRRGVFSIDEPSPTVRGVNRPIPAGYQGHHADAAPITTPGLRPLTTKERSLIQTFPMGWKLIGAKSDVEQIIGNAVPVNLAAFVGRAIKEWDVVEQVLDDALSALHYCDPDVERPKVQGSFVFEERDGIYIVAKNPAKKTAKNPAKKTAKNPAKKTAKNPAKKTAKNPAKKTPPKI